MAAKTTTTRSTKIKPMTRTLPLAEELQETDPVALKQLAWVEQNVPPKSLVKVRADVRAIEAAGGLWSVTTKQRRTPGGVFFLLVKGQRKSWLKELCKVQSLALAELRGPEATAPKPPPRPRPAPTPKPPPAAPAPLPLAAAPARPAPRPAHPKWAPEYQQPEVYHVRGRGQPRPVDMPG